MRMMKTIFGKKKMLLAGFLALLLFCSACGGSSGGSGTISRPIISTSSISKPSSTTSVGSTASISRPSSTTSIGSTASISRPSLTSKPSNTSKPSSNTSRAESTIPERVTLADSRVYTFYNAATNSYLSHNDRTLVLSSTPTNWILKDANGSDFYLYAHETDLLLDIDNAHVATGTTIKLWNFTGYPVQIWKINRNSNGTYSILHSGDTKYCLGFAGSNAKLQIHDGINQMQEWIVTDVSDTLRKDYLSYKSNGNIIELQLPLDILNYISEARLKQWANELEAAYYSFAELTSFYPYRNIIVEAYKPSPTAGYLGWVYDHSNILHIDSTFLYSEMQKMAARASDWNFCALHEMGHMFDCARPWNFETEMMTDLKLAYVLEKNNVAASPSEFDVSTVFYGKEIRNAYATLSSDFSSNYDIFGCVERFLRIKDDIGWEPFRRTFYDMQANESQYKNYSKQAKLEAFVSLLSTYGNTNVKAYFSAAEWNTILQKCQ